MGWEGNWPPTSLRQLFNLYGGPRRFFVVNVPFLFIALVANFLGSLSVLLSFEQFRPLVRKYRLDGVYPVFGLKRHYIDAPLSCTFSYPGAWVYDPVLEASRMRREAQEAQQSLRKAPKGSPLPLVALVPAPGSADGGAGTSVALYAQPVGRVETLEELLGSPEEAQGRVGAVALGYLPARKGREAQAELVSATKLPPPSPGGRASYQLELRVRYLEVSSPDAAPREVLGWSVWSTVQLAIGPRQAYLLILAASVPAGAPEGLRADTRRATESLEFLAEQMGG